MLRLKIVGRKEEPVQVPQAGAPGAPQTFTQVICASILVQSVDAAGDPIAFASNGMPLGGSTVFAIPVVALADVADLVTGDIHDLPGV